ncbi:hypothetical protein Zm00014a_018080 [Zea mays]|uniref:Uncharacterized protein n=1 Tax=Zea mays TaxID=4577 RepID=A0A3L6FLM9_MAIZE|nr:hypothetical protein Zm00014a_018080 [Zea mays]
MSSFLPLVVFFFLKFCSSSVL